MKKKNGFTLVELLATIAILGLLATIAGISVSGILKRSKEDISGIQENMIIEAAKSYVIEHRNNCRNGCFITEYGIGEYMDYTTSETTEKKVKSVLVTKNDNNKLDYEISENNISKNCTCSDETEKCISDINLGEYTNGICNCSSGKYSSLHINDNCK